MIYIKKYFSVIALILSLAVGMYMRTYQFKERFQYGHDNDLAGWIVKDIMIDHHLRLIGQLTSAPGIFIGPIFYYLLIPLYSLTHMDPIGILSYAWIISVFSIFSMHYVTTKIFGKKIGAISALIFASSYLIAFTEREVVPTTPVFLWSVWFLYSLYLTKSGKKIGLTIVAILVGLIWEVNLSLVLLTPLFFATLFINIKKFKIKDLLLPILIVVFVSSPLLLFEVRHGFSQTKSLIATLSPANVEKVNYSAKLNRVSHLISKNATRTFGDFPDTNYALYYLIPIGLLAGIFILAASGKLSWYYPILFLSWVLLFVVFYTFHPINVSEYYLNGATIIWVIAAALLLSRFPVPVIILGLSFFVVNNAKIMFDSNINRNGYLDRKAIVQYIFDDAQKNNYPCVSVSYMTDPGNNLGYRYLFWLKGMHVNLPKSLSPVYTIVFPHPRANKLDYTSGALGLVLPSYSLYTKEGVAQSCVGENTNLTDSMFGFTK